MTAIQFCEPSYLYSPFEIPIAEFWNTISSFAYCITGIAYLIRLKSLRAAHPDAFSGASLHRFVGLGLSIIAVGVGSALLHATQTWWGELADEFAMLITGIFFLFCQEDLHPFTSGTKRFWFYGAVIASVVIVTSLYLIVFLHGIFAILFAAIVGLCITIFATSPLYNILSASQFKLREGSVLGRLGYGPRFFLGTVLSAIGFAAWAVDQTCARMEWKDTSLGWLYVFHPAWHLLTAAAASLYFDLILNVRVALLGSPFARTRSGAFVPKFLKDE